MKIGISGCIFVFIGILISASLSVQAAENDLRDRYMKVCKDDLDRNFPGWSPEQAEQLCNCRARFLWAKESQAGIGLLVGAFETQDPMAIPEPLEKADLAYLETCSKDFEAQP